MNFGYHEVELGQSNFVSSATQQHPLGTKGRTQDGRMFVYVRAGASDLVAGNVIQSAATSAGHLTLAVNTTSGGTSPGSTSIAVTCVSAVSTGFYNEGYAIVATGSGQGSAYGIQVCPAVSTGATGVFTLYTEDAIPSLTNMTISTSSKISLVPNPYQNVIQAPATTLTGMVAGVAQYVITATQFGWIQTWGLAAVISNDTTAAGDPVIGVASTAGRVEGIVSATSGATATFLGNMVRGPVIGYMVVVGVQGEVRPVFLTIAP